MQPNKRVSTKHEHENHRSNILVRRRIWFPGLVFFSGFLFLICQTAYSQASYENRRIEKIDVSLGGNDTNTSAAEQFRLIARDAVGPKYAAVKVRDALQALYDTKKIASVTVEATDAGADGVNLRFIIKRKTQAEKVVVQIGNKDGDPVTEQELLFKLNLLAPGTPITEQTLRNNADIILDYLRERGFYKSEVTYTQQPLQNDNEVGVTFRVAPNAQAKVESFKVNIQGYDTAKLTASLKLHTGELYSRDRLNKDIDAIRGVLRKDEFLAPELDEPRVRYDSDSNSISIELTG